MSPNYPTLAFHFWDYYYIVTSWSLVDWSHGRYTRKLWNAILPYHGGNTRTYLIMDLPNSFTATVKMFPCLYWGNVEVYLTYSFQPEYTFVIENYVHGTRHWSGPVPVAGEPWIEQKFLERCYPIRYLPYFDILGLRCGLPLPKVCSSLWWYDELFFIRTASSLLFLCHPVFRLREIRQFSIKYTQCTYNRIQRQAL